MKMLIYLFLNENKNIFFKCTINIMKLVGHTKSTFLILLIAYKNTKKKTHTHNLIQSFKVANFWINHQYLCWIKYQIFRFQTIVFFSNCKHPPFLIWNVKKNTRIKKEKRPVHQCGSTFDIQTVRMFERAKKLMEAHFKASYINCSQALQPPLFESNLKLLCFILLKPLKIQIIT